MKKNNLTYLIIICSVIVVYIIFKRQAQNATGPIPSNAVADINSNVEKPIDQDATRTQPIGGFSGSQNHSNTLPKSENKEEAPQIENPLDVASEKSNSEFKKTARLEFKMPMHMRYTKLDLTIEGVAGEYGRSADGKSGVSVFATDRKEFNESSIKTFLETSSDEIPNLKNTPVRWKDTPERVPAPAASGIKEAKIWTGSDLQGNSYAAAYLPREDGKGSYLFVYNTKGPGVYENDGTFDLMFSEVKALAP